MPAFDQDQHCLTLFSYRLFYGKSNKNQNNQQKPKTRNGPIQMLMISRLVKNELNRHIYSAELKTQHLIYQLFYCSFHMQTFINLISLFFRI